jgi:hypothetical protein
MRGQWRWWGVVCEAARVCDGADAGACAERAGDARDCGDCEDAATAAEGAERGELVLFESECYE